MIIAIKDFIEPTFGISNDALHIWLGILLQLGVAQIFRTRIASVWPWLVVLGLEILNELNDLSERWPGMLATQLGEGAKDLIVTMVIPTVLMLLARKQARVLA